MDIKLYYKEAGQGTPLIMLHGNGESCDYFEHQIPYFSVNYRVIAVDTRGHGKSPRGTEPFTLSRFADDLRELTGELRISKAIILGFSDGANIAMIYALRYPERVSGLILNGANAFFNGLKASVGLSIKAGYAVSELFSRKSEKALRSSELFGIMLNEPTLTFEELSQITAPTLVIAGSNDMIKDCHTRALAEHIPKSELVIIKGNHFIANKKHEKFNTAVEDFLKRTTF